MRHLRNSKKFSRSSNKRKNLWRSLLSSLIINGSLITTISKGAYVKKGFDKLVAKVRRNPLLAKKTVYQEIPNKSVVDKFIKDVLPLLPSKTGLVSNVRLGRRKGDNADMVKVSFLISESPVIAKELKPKSNKIEKDDKLNTEK